MECGTHDLVCKALHRLGLEGSAADNVESFIEGPFKIAFILVAAGILSRHGSRLAVRAVTRLGLANPLAEKSPRVGQRTATLARVAANTLRVAVWTVAALLVAGEVGINLGPLLAGAGIVGLALAFGTQSLVKDFVSGFFILAEDQYGVGDLITVGPVTGTVEDVNLRVTSVRANDGTLWFVPNGEIRMVGNAAKDWVKAVVDVVVNRGADLARAIAAITEEVKGLAADPAWEEVLLDEPEVLGVESMGTEGVTVRVEVRTALGNRMRVARELRTRVGARLYAEGISIRPEPGESAPAGRTTPATPLAPAPPEAPPSPDRPLPSA